MDCFTFSGAGLEAKALSLTLPLLHDLLPFAVLDYRVIMNNCKHLSPPGLLLMSDVAAAAPFLPSHSHVLGLCFFDTLLRVLFGFLWFY